MGRIIAPGVTVLRSVGDAIGTPLRAAVVAYYKLENVNDSGPNGLHMTNVGTATFTSGKLGNALTLDGTSQYLNLADNDLLDLGSGVSMGVNFWFKKTDQTGFRVFVTKAPSGGGAWSGWAVASNSSNRLTVEVGNGTNVWTGYGSGDTPLGADTWMMATANLNKDTTTITTYINGVQDRTGSNAAVGGSYANNQPFRIGNGRFGVEYVNGQMDEVCIKAGIFTADEIAYLYNSGAGRSLYE